MFRVSRRRGPKEIPHFSDRKQRILAFLRENPTGVLSTVTPDGNPHGVVIYFRVNTDFTVSFLTKTGTRKYDNILHDNHVMLTVFEPHSQATAQVIGVAQKLADSYEINELAATILTISMETSEAGTPPISKLVSGDYAAFRIEPLQIRMAVYDRPDSGEYGQLFESVESFELNDEGY